MAIDTEYIELLQAATPNRTRESRDTAITIVAADQAGFSDEHFQTELSKKTGSRLQYEVNFPSRC